MNYLPLSLVEKYIPLMRAKGVSSVARSARGFIPAYRKAGNRSGLSKQWQAKRDAFIARHMAQVKKRGEPLWKNGMPTRRHLALIAWAYSPTPGKLKQYKKNPSHDLLPKKGTDFWEHLWRMGRSEFKSMSRTWDPEYDSHVRQALDTQIQRLIESMREDADSLRDIEKDGHLKLMRLPFDEVKQRGDYRYDSGELAEVIESGADLVPISVGAKGEDGPYWVLDGHHRLRAYGMTGKPALAFVAWVAPKESEQPQLHIDLSEPATMNSFIQNPAPEVDPKIYEGELVRVHYNLGRCRRGKPKPGESCFVVSTRKQGWRKVDGYVASILLKDAEFVVSKAGVDNIRNVRKKRNVVAWIQGTAVNPNTKAMKRAIGSDDWYGVGFDPFTGYKFYLPEIAEEVDEAPLVYLSGRKAIALFDMPNPGHEAEHGEGELEALIEVLGEDVSY